MDLTDVNMGVRPSWNIEVCGTALLCGTLVRSEP